MMGEGQLKKQKKTQMTRKTTKNKQEFQCKTRKTQG